MRELKVGVVEDGAIIGGGGDRAQGAMRHVVVCLTSTWPGYSLDGVVVAGTVAAIARENLAVVIILSDFDLVPDDDIVGRVHVGPEW